MSIPSEKIARFDTNQPIDLTKESCQIDSSAECPFPDGTTCLTSVVGGKLGSCILHDSGKNLYLSNL